MNLISNHIKHLASFEELVSMPFSGDVNAMCWDRILEGDFSELVNKFHFDENIKEIDEQELRDLHLTDEGKIARDILLQDWKLLKDYGALPVLNLIKHYDRDDEFPFFPTDVYSFHVDRSPIPIDTFLCTYYGDSSEIIPNAVAKQKVLMPEIREKLKLLYEGEENGFESYLVEHFFDLHYELNPYAQPISLGLGRMWRLAVDHPECQVPPCIHRAPIETSGKTRLLMIC